MTLKPWGQLRRKKNPDLPRMTDEQWVGGIVGMDLLDRGSAGAGGADAVGLLLLLNNPPGRSESLDLDVDDEFVFRTDRRRSS